MSLYNISTTEVFVRYRTSSVFYLTATAIAVYALSVFMLAHSVMLHSSPRTHCLRCTGRCALCPPWTPSCMSHSDRQASQHPPALDNVVYAAFVVKGVLEPVRTLYLLDLCFGVLTSIRLCVYVSVCVGPNILLHGMLGGRSRPLWKCVSTGPRG